MRYVIDASYRDQTVQVHTQHGTAIREALTRVYCRLVAHYPRLARAEHFRPDAPCTNPDTEGVWWLEGGRYIQKSKATAIGPRVIARVTCVR